MNLSEHLNADLMQCRVPVDGWEEAIRAAGELLVAAGKIQAKYIDTMINAHKELGPYMVIAPGLALAHARPDESVREMGVSMITLNSPVEFGAEKNDPVSLVLALAATDSSSHIELLSKLAGFLADEQRRQELVDAQSVVDMVAIVDRYDDEQI